MSTHICEGCGYEFDVADYHTRSDDDGRGNEIPVQCGPVSCNDCATRDQTIAELRKDLPLVLDHVYAGHKDYDDVHAAADRLRAFLALHSKDGE